MKTKNKLVFFILILALIACSLAYHVINAEDADHFIVATALTPSFDEYKKEKGITGHIPQSDYYELMPEAKVEYQSEESDLAIISFQYKEELDIAEIADSNPRKGDRIVAVGNPDNPEGIFYSFIWQDFFLKGNHL